MLLGHIGGIRDVLIDEICVYGIVEVDLIGLGLPMGAEDNNSLWLDFLSDLLPYVLKDRVDGVFGVELYIGL